MCYNLQRGVLMELKGLTKEEVEERIRNQLRKYFYQIYLHTLIY